MAHDINSVILVGRLTRDAELKYTNAGTALCKFSIAVNRKKKTGDQWTEEVSYFDVNIWGKHGEAVHQYLTKGQQVVVMGELRQNRWEQDGYARSKVEITAENIQLIGGKNNSGQSHNNTSGFGASQPSENAFTRASNKPQGTMDFEDDIPF